MKEFHPCQFSGPTGQPESLMAIVGGVVAVMVVFILAVTAIIIAVLVTKNCKRKYSTDPDVR